MASLKKIAQVQSIDQSLKQTKNFVLLKYSEVPTQLFDGLRKSLKKANSALSVVKN
ncbi:50S ribosomal protein L10, partial [Candidatus Roizmanbacteria bacterium CG_4_8_14_3_um_filter_36_10]